MLHRITGKEKIILTALIVTLFVTACSSPSESVKDVIADAVSSESSSSISSEATSSEKELSSESESPSSLSSYISEVSSSESSQTETSETSSEDISSSSDVEATVKAEEIRAAEKAKQEEELRIQQEAQEKARQEAEAALKAEQEKATSSSSQGSNSSSNTSAETPSKPAEKPADSQTSEQPTQSEPQSNAQQSGKYALNEYGNPSIDVLYSKVQVMVNPADPALQKELGGRGTQDPNVKIPNPFASMQPISPYIGQANPPAAWPKPTPQGHGEYKWSPEAGCWRYYNGEASDKYVSIYGVETWAQSKLEKTNPGCTSLRPNSRASRMGIYGV